MKLTKLSEKVRYYRKLKGLSQLELETAINASPGSISRIESGKVNPTKETLYLLATELGLDDTEKKDFFGLHPLLPSKEEIFSAIEEVREYFEKDNTYAYLLDEWVNFYYASNSLAELLGIEESKLNRLSGKNMIEIMTDPQYGIRQLFDPTHFIEMYSNEIARTRMEVNLEKHFPEMIKRLHNLPGFGEIWEKSSDPSRVFSQSAKVVYMKIAGKSLRFQFARERLKSNARFEIIELHSPQPY